MFPRWFARIYRGSLLAWTGWGSVLGFYHIFYIKFNQFPHPLSDVITLFGKRIKGQALQLLELNKMMTKGLGIITVIATNSYLNGPEL